jgi:hypothetical protein
MRLLGLANIKRPRSRHLEGVSLAYRGGVADVIVSCRQVWPLLVNYKAILSVFEGDRFGTISEFFPRLRQLDRALVEVPRDFGEGVDAARSKMEALHKKYRDVWLPIMSEAVWCNPGMGIDELTRLERREIHGKVFLYPQREQDELDRARRAEPGERRGPSPEAMGMGPEDRLQQMRAEERELTQQAVGRTRRAPPAGRRLRLEPEQQLAAYEEAVEELPENFDLLGWMVTSQREEWPELWKWMMMRLARLCTSAETERHFNLCGSAESLRRCSLSDTRVRDLAMCAGNPDLIYPAVEESMTPGQEHNVWHSWPSELGGDDRGAEEEDDSGEWPE